jgi:hypothetical protein
MRADTAAPLDLGAYLSRGGYSGPRSPTAALRALHRGAAPALRCVTWAFYCPATVSRR